MQRLNREITVETPPVVLYLDSVQKIVDYLAEYQGEGQGGEPVLITTNSCEFENAHDLKSMQEKFTHELQITGTRISTKDGGGDEKDTITVRFDHINCSVKASNDDRSTRAFVDDIHKELLKNRHTFAFTKNIKVFGWVMGIGTLLYLMLSLTSREFDSLITSVFIILLCAYIAVAGYLNFHVSTIKLRFKADNPSIWFRKRDDFIVNAIVSAVFLIIGIFVGIYLQKSGITK